MALLSKPSRSVDLVSAYFVPGGDFSDALGELARAGIRVRILTNSQADTDVGVVHRAYVKYRPHLLQTGVELYGPQPAFSPRESPPHRVPAASARAQLHSKPRALTRR